MPVETSVVIRTRNEEQWLGTVLTALTRQSYKNFEILIVDSGSRDRTLEVANEFPTKIFRIPPEKFSYPYALNYGIARAQATRYIVIISGHSIPVSNTWLEDGLKNFQRYQNIAGVYGFLKPMPGSSLADKVIMNGLNFLRRMYNHKQRFVITRPGMGVLGFTNAIIRKDLWNQRQLNETHGAGGEDGEWAAYWVNHGFKIIKDWSFSVYHSHNLGFWGWYKQLRYWKSLDRPLPFRLLLFRKDKTHSA